MASPLPIKCRAAVAWGAKQALVIEEIEVAAPQAAEVRIRMVAASVCHTDLTFLQSEHIPFPRILGHEGAGIIESVGDGVEEFKVGDHVLPMYVGECGMCGPCKSEHNNLCQKYWPLLKTNLMLQSTDEKSRFSINKEGISQSILPFFTSTFTEYTVVHVDCVAKINPQIPLEKACLFACGVPTGLGAVWNTAKVEKGSTVAIFGLGTIGLAVADGARIAGASRIIGIDINPNKFDLAKKFGVTEFVNPNDYDAPIQQVLKDRTNGGVDYSFECVGKIQLMNAAFECTCEGQGKTVILGMDASGQQFNFIPTSLFGRTIMGSIFGGFKGKTQIPNLVDKIVRKEVIADEYITHVLPLKDINAAFDLLESGKSLRCVLTME